MLITVELSYKWPDTTFFSWPPPLNGSPQPEFSPQFGLEVGAGSSLEQLQRSGALESVLRGTLWTAMKLLPLYLSLVVFSARVSKRHHSLTTGEICLPILEKLYGNYLSMIIWKQAKIRPGATDKRLKLCFADSISCFEFSTCSGSRLRLVIVTFNEVFKMSLS